METKIQSFGIEGLFGDRNISATFRDNNAVLVGENGMGKSHFIQMLFFCLKRDWLKLSNMNFEAFTICINDKEHRIAKKDIDQYYEPLLGNLSSIMHKKRAEKIYELIETEKYIDIAEIKIHSRRFSESTGLPERYVFDFISDLPSAAISKLHALSKDIQNLDCNIIYFPTYRKIDVELNELFNDSSSRFIEQMESQLSYKDGDMGEIISFGMKDIENLIKRNSEYLSRDFNESVNKMMKIVLEQSFRGDIPHVTPRELNKKSLKGILSRMGIKGLDDRMLSQITEKAPSKKDTEDKKFISYLIKEIMDLYHTQQSKEHSIIGFTDSCNKFLRDKEIVFDSISFEVTIRSKRIRENFEDEDSTLNLSDLSSGEKQIVSIFARLWLTNSEFLVLMDEPELSLSMEWQKILLTEIDRIPTCKGVIAVTHSPFIFDNGFDTYARDFEIES